MYDSCEQELMMKYLSDNRLIVEGENDVFEFWFPQKTLLEDKRNVMFYRDYHWPSQIINVKIIA